MKKTVNINLDGDMMEQLKKSDYKLCIAKKIENYDYNVVWYCSDKYLEVNSFSWEPQYEMFATNSFCDGGKLEASCTPVAIEIGEITTLSEYGRLSPAKSGGAADALNVKNEYGNIRFGVKQLCTGVDDKHYNTAIFVTPNAVLRGTAAFKPSEKILVWFEKEIESSTMFVRMKSGDIEVDLSCRSQIDLLYDASGSWRIK